MMIIDINLYFDMLNIVCTGIGLTTQLMFLMYLMCLYLLRGLRAVPISFQHVLYKKIDGNKPFKKHFS